MNTYKDSLGNRYTQAQIDYRIREAKKKALAYQADQFGYNFCEQCGRNSSDTMLDCSHDISVKRAKEEGSTQKAWDVRNIVIRCRPCHKKHDGLDLQFSKSKEICSK